MNSNESGTCCPSCYLFSDTGMTRLTEAQTAALKGSSQSKTHSDWLTFIFPAKLEAREEHIRESWVKAMEARLVREELEKCQKYEGVNHYENCRWLSEKYLDMLKENRVSFSFNLRDTWTEPRMFV
jgi:hypothetical protein